MSNIRSSELFKYKINKNIDGSLEYPKIFLMSRTLKKRGLITPVEKLIITPKFGETNECSFTIHKINDGVTMPLFNQIKDLSIIRIEGFGLYQIKISNHETDSTYKEITGQCLQACELGQTNCKLEINTEDDPNLDVKGSDNKPIYPTLFYREDGHTEASLLHRILTYAPTYSIAYVDPSLKGLNREFSCDTSVFDFLQTVGEEIGCIFVFHKYTREISVFDLEDHCTNPKCSDGRHIINGVCQSCHSSAYIEKGYGLNTSTLINTHNLATEISDTIDSDSIKNCFKLVAGDDETTNRIGQRLIGGSNYIWTFSDFEIEEMSPELQDKWRKYNDFVQVYQDEFNTTWNEYNQAVNDISYWQSSKMPIVENPLIDNTDPNKTCKNIFEEIKKTITYFAISSEKTTASTIASKLLDYATLICPEGYDVEYQKDTEGNKRYSSVKNDEGIITSFSCYLYIYLKNYPDETDNKKDKYYYKSDEWVLNVIPGYNQIEYDGIYTTDYYLFLKQQLEYGFAKLDVTYSPKYDTDYDDGVENHLKDTDYYKNYFREYGINRLQSFKDAYDTCTVILFEQNETLTDPSSSNSTATNKYITENHTQSKLSLYDELSKKYIAFSDYIDSVINEYQEIVDGLIAKRDNCITKINKINQTCNIQNYLGENLYHELLTFKREDTYENQNFTSDVIDESTLMENIEEFIIKAKIEIAKACQPNHETTIAMSQILSLSDYETVLDSFTVGNYIRSTINDEPVKMRIISIPFNFDNIEESSITFSDSLVGNNQIKTMQEQLKQASSMATSFSYVQKQTHKNDTNLSDVMNSLSNGLDATKNMIMNSENQDIIIDSHGVLGRELDTENNNYQPWQYRLNSKGLIFTDNDWETIKTALGKVFWNGEWRYGLLAEVIVGKILAGEQLIIEGKDGSVIIDGNGITLDGGAIKWKSKLPTSSVDGLDEQVSDFIKSIGDLQSQIDGEITSWFEEYDPSTTNEPASTWTTDEDKIKHEGDLFYNTSTGAAYRYIYNSSTNVHEWSVITDTTVTKALADAAKAQDTADKKRRVFVVEPKPPYDIGDLWTQGSSGDIMKCKVAKTEGQSYSASDWEKASKYTDDTAWKTWTSDSGEFGQYKSEIQTQIDGKSNCTYGGATPPSNPETGDLWFCTDSSNGYDANKAYMYNGSAWKESNGVPDSVWDIADGKSSIFVVKPNKALSSVDSHFYYANDIWILESDMILNGKSYKKGSIMTSTSDSTSFIENHWVEKVRYTDDVLAQEALDKAEQGIEDAVNAVGLANNAQSKADSAYTRAENAETNAKNYAVSQDETLSINITDAYQKYTNSKVKVLDDSVSKYLGLGGTTIVSNEYMVSPYLGGGYLNIASGNKRVIIDPKNLGNTGYIFQVHNDSEISVGIEADGNAIVNGKIIAKELTISDPSKVSGMKIVKETKYEYAKTTTPTQPTSGWSTSYPTSVSNGDYIWIKTTISYMGTAYSDDVSYSYSYIGTNGTNGKDGKDGTNGKDGENGKDGINGNDGISVTSVTFKYGLSTSSSTEPSSWHDSIPTVTSLSQYVWRKTTVNYSNSTSSVTTVYDEELTNQTRPALATDITSSGVKIHPVGNTSDYLNLTSNNMDIASGGYVKAHFGTDGIWLGGSSTSSVSSTNYVFKVDTDGNGSFAGELSCNTGNIGGYVINNGGMYTTTASYLTTISNDAQYTFPTYHGCTIYNFPYQTTIRNGKIICGVDNIKAEKNYGLPYTKGGYVDLSAHGIFSKRRQSYDGEELPYLFAVKTLGEQVIVNGEFILNGESSVNATSDRKKKQNIKEIDANWAIEFINNLKPSTYKYKDNIYNKTHYGMIAQEVEQTILDMGMERLDFSGLVKTPKEYDISGEEIPDDYDFDKADEEYNYYLRYDDFIAPIIKYCQELYKQNQETLIELNSLKEQVKELLS